MALTHATHRGERRAAGHAAAAPAARTLAPARGARGTPRYLQRHAAPGASVAPAADPRPALGAGQALGTPLRQHLEPLFGRSLAPVRVHTGPAAAMATRAVSAQAFTLGHHIAFAPGKFAPHTRAGLHLLAHEVAHTVQQERMPPAVMRRGVVPGPAGGHHEREAEVAADRVLQGQRVMPLTPVGSAQLQRSPNSGAGTATLGHADGDADAAGTAGPAGPGAGLAGLWHIATDVAGRLWSGASSLVLRGAAAVRVVAGSVVDRVHHAGSALWARAAGALRWVGGLLRRGQDWLGDMADAAYQRTLAPLVNGLQTSAWWHGMVGGLHQGVAAMGRAAMLWLNGNCAQMGQSVMAFEHWLGERLHAVIETAHRAWRRMGARLTALWQQASGALHGLLSSLWGNVQHAAQFVWSQWAPVRSVIGQAGSALWGHVGVAAAWLREGLAGLLGQLTGALQRQVARMVTAAQPLMGWVAGLAQRLMNGLPPQIADPLRQLVRRTVQRWRRLWRALQQGGLPGLILQAADDFLTDVVVISAFVSMLVERIGSAFDDVALMLGRAAQVLTEAVASVAARAARALMAMLGMRRLISLAGVAAAGAQVVAALARMMWRALVAQVTVWVLGAARRLRAWRAWAAASLRLAGQQLMAWWEDHVWQRLIALLAWARATPCLRELLMVMRLDSLLATLGRIRTMVRNLVHLARNPAPLLAAVYRALGQRMARVPAWIAQFQATLLFPGQPAHQAGVMRHLQPALENLAAHWWEQLKELGGTLLWPWPSVRQGLPEFGRHGLNFAVALARLDVDTAINEGLAGLQQLNGMLGALWGWFAIAATVVGGAMGAIGAGPSMGASIWAGMGAGFAVAAEVGELLLAVTLGTEWALIGKGLADVYAANPRITDSRRRDEANDAAYERIAHGTFTLAVLDALAGLAWLVSRFVSAVWRAGHTLVANPEAPVARGGLRRAVPADISAADIEAAGARLREVIDERGRARTPRDASMRSRYDLEVELEDGWTWRRDAESGRWCLSINPGRCGIDLDPVLGRRAARAAERAEAARARDAVSERIADHDARVALDSEAASLLESARQKLLRVRDLDAPTPLDILTPSERALVNRMLPGGSAEGVALRQTLRRLREVFEETTDALDAARSGQRDALEAERHRAGRALYDFLRERSPNAEAVRVVNERARGVDELNNRPLAEANASLDHVPPLNEVIDIPGFRSLHEWQQLELVNDPAFLRRAERGPNSARGDRSFNTVEPGRYLNRDQLAAARLLEATHREAIRVRIAEMLRRRGR